MPRQRKRFTAHLEGSEQLNAALRGMRDRASGFTLQEAAREGAQVIADEASRQAPKDEGDLSEGIRARAAVRQQIGRARIDVGPTRDVFYGMFSELGTSHEPAKPWLRPAFDAKREEATRVVREALKKALGL